MKEFQELVDGFPSLESPEYREYIFDGSKLMHETDYTITEKCLRRFLMNAYTDIYFCIETKIDDKKLLETEEQKKTKRQFTINAMNVDLSMASAEDFLLLCQQGIIE